MSNPDVFVDKDFPQDIKSLAQANQKNFSDLLKVDLKKIKWMRV